MADYFKPENQMPEELSAGLKWLAENNERDRKEKAKQDNFQPSALLDEVLGDIPKIKKYEAFLAVRRFTPAPGDSQKRIAAKIESAIDEIRPFAPGGSQEKLLTLWSVPIAQLGKE